jgi:hypothetical protein
MWPQVTSSGKSKTSGSGGWDFFSSDGNATDWNGSSIVMIKQQKTIAGREEGPRNLNSKGLLVSRLASFGVPESSHVEGQALPGLAKTWDETLIFFFLILG